MDKTKISLKEMETLFKLGELTNEQQSSRDVGYLDVVHQMYRSELGSEAPKTVTEPVIAKGFRNVLDNAFVDKEAFLSAYEAARMSGIDESDAKYDETREVVTKKVDAMRAAMNEPRYGVIAVEKGDSNVEPKDRNTRWQRYSDAPLDIRDAYVLMEKQKGNELLSATAIVPHDVALFLDGKIRREFNVLDGVLYKNHPEEVGRTLEAGYGTAGMIELVQEEQSATEEAVKAEAGKRFTDGVDPDALSHGWQELYRERVRGIIGDDRGVKR